MEPQFNGPSNMNLPPIAAEGFSTAAPTERASLATPEASHQTAEPLMPTNSSAAIASPLPPIPFQPSTAAPSTTNDDANTTNLTLPPVADDGDLIEKEWVTKAKEIVAKTAENPYQQTKEMTNLKASYMQKRYQKTVKLSE